MHHSDIDIRNRLLIARLPAMPQILIKLIEHLQADGLGMPVFQPFNSSAQARAMDSV
jgi:hypothetical protein